jgi:hypothetical protein
MSVAAALIIVEIIVVPFFQQSVALYSATVPVSPAARSMAFATAAKHITSVTVVIFGSSRMVLSRMTCDQLCVLGFTPLA